MNYAILGRKINKSRIDSGLTQAQLAERANVTPAYIGQIERGERKFSIETLVALCNALKVSADYLLRDSLEVETGSVLAEINSMLSGKGIKELTLSADILSAVHKYLDKK